MFKSILVPIDLADTDLAKPAIATAATLSQTWSGFVRLLNVLPMTPVMLAEYVPADFDVQQRASSEEALTIVGARIPASKLRGFPAWCARAASITRSSEGSLHQGRPHRHDLAPPGDAHLFLGSNAATWCATPNARCWCKALRHRVTRVRTRCGILHAAPRAGTATNTGVRYGPALQRTATQELRAALRPGAHIQLLRPLPAADRSMVEHGRMCLR